METNLLFLLRPPSVPNCVRENADPSQPPPGVCMQRAENSAQEVKAFLSGLCTALLAFFFRMPDLVQPRKGAFLNESPPPAGSR